MSSKRVLITGGSKGIGLNVAARLATEDHRPVGVARMSPSDYPGEFFAADLADRDDAERVFAEILRAGPVDAVVNNVGLVRPAMLGEVDLDDLAPGLCQQPLLLQGAGAEPQGEEQRAA